METVQFEIKQINLVGIRTPASINTHCDLCRKHLCAPSENDLAERRMNSEIVIGRCRHGFHSDCINRWQIKGSNICPIDKTEWLTNISAKDKPRTLYTKS